MIWDEFHAQVSDQDKPQGETHGSIQWKGTDVCMDVTCACGHVGHFDGDFFYYFECPKCHAKYAVGQRVKLVPLNDEQAAFIQTTGHEFKTVELEE